MLSLPIRFRLVFTCSSSISRRMWELFSFHLFQRYTWTEAKEDCSVVKPQAKNTKDVGIYFYPFLLFFSPSTLSLRNCFLNYIYCKCLINKIYCLQGRVPILHLVDTGSMAQAFLLCFSPLNFFLLLPFLVPLHTFLFLAFLSRA